MELVGLSKDPRTCLTSKYMSVLKMDMSVITDLFVLKDTNSKTVEMSDHNG